jgi:hypothetical protein
VISPRIRFVSFLNLRTLALFGLAAAALAVTACGSSGGSGGDAASVTSVQFVETSANVAAVPNPTSQQLTLVVQLSDGTTMQYSGGVWPLSMTVTWSSDDPAIATVFDGSVTGVQLGQTMIRATIGAMQASVPANVASAPVTTPVAVPVSDTGTSNSINGSGFSNGFRCIAIDHLGRIHATWFDSNTGLRYTRSLDGGLSFLPSVLLADLTSAPNPSPVIGCAQDAQDNVYVVYTDSTNVVRCLRSPDAATTWQTPGVATGLPAFNNSLTVAVRGSTVAIFASGGATLVRSTDSGQTFGAPVPGVLSGVAFGDVLMDPRNLNVVVISDTPDVHMRVAPDDGVTFGPQVDQSAAPLFYSDYAIDQLGNAYGVGSQSDWARIDVDAQTITPAVSAMSGFGNPGRSIAVDGSNVVHIVRDESGNVLLQTSADQGATLTPDLTLDSGSTPECAGSFSFPGVGVLYVKGGAVMYMHN